MSRLGSTNDPDIVVESSDISYVIWHDQDSGYLFSRLENDEWSSPIQAKFPFNRN